MGEPKLADVVWDLVMETWKPVVGLDGRYDVSDLGRVRNHRTGQILKTSLIGGAACYHSVNLPSPKGFRRRIVHRLVLEAFVGPCPPGMQGAHCDGNPDNNALANLEWKTPKANSEDRIIHGTSKKGSKHNLAILDEAAVISMRADKVANPSITLKELGAKYGVSLHVAHQVLTRRTWKHV